MVDSEELVQLQSTRVTSGILVLRGHVSKPLWCVLFAYGFLDTAAAKILRRWEIRAHLCLLCFFLEVAYLYVRLLSAAQRGVHCRAATPSGDKPLSPRGNPAPCPRAVVPVRKHRTRGFTSDLLLQSCFHLNRSKWASACIRGRNPPLLPVTRDQFVHTISSGKWERSPIKKLGKVGPLTCSIFGVVPHYPTLCETATCSPTRLAHTQLLGQSSHCYTTHGRCV